MHCRHKAQCLVCGHKDFVYHQNKEDYQEVRVCPKCNGAYVDTWKLPKFLSNTNNQIEISMVNPNEPPKIKLNGQVIDDIISLDYKYETRDDQSQGQHNFVLKYCDKESNTVRTVGTNKVMEG